jgi:hypothetical protein
MVGGAVLTLGGCVSQQTYESARQEAKTRSNELAQVQAEIQSLEQQRDETHAANQRDEHTLANLRNELHGIQASFDQIRKTNQARLAALQHSVTALRARHQAMLKEISETKRYEKKLEVLTAQREEALAAMPGKPEAQVTTVDGFPQEPRMVALITPELPRSKETLSSFAVPSSLPPDAPPASGMSPSGTSPQPTSGTVAAPPPAKVPANTTSVSATTAPTSNIPPGHQNDSWLSSMTAWLTSMFGWLWP